MSLPSQGAWIEICTLSPPDSSMIGRSLHRERGLKSSFAGNGVKVIESLPSQGAWIEMSTVKSFKSLDVVAPFTGSVD